MRRYLGTLLGISAVVAAAASGCASLEATSDASSMGGGGTSTGTSMDTGAGGAEGTGSPSKATETEADVPLTNPDASLICTENAPKAGALFLSRPNARAMASGAQVRGAIRSKKAPLPSVVQPEEILNYYHVACPVEETSVDGLSVAPALFFDEAAGDYVLQVTVCAPASKLPRPQTSLTVLVDTSKSMAGQSMMRAVAAVKELASRLNLGDKLTLLTTDPGGTPFVQKGDTKELPELVKLLDELTVSGDNDLNVSLRRAYELAAGESLPAGGLNRVVLITDGGAAGDKLDTMVIDGGWVNQQIQLVGVGVGDAAGYHDELLTAATQAGHGAKIYLDSVNEAKAMLGERFNQVFATAAREVTISIQLPWLFESSPVDVMPAPTVLSLQKSDLAPGRSMVFRRALHTCAAVALEQNPTEIIEVGAQWLQPDSNEEKKALIPVTIAHLLKNPATDQVLKTSAIYAFANALPALDLSRLKRACVTVSNADKEIASHNPNGPLHEPELDEILGLIQHHPLMEGEECQ